MIDILKSSFTVHTTKNKNGERFFPYTCINNAYVFNNFLAFDLKLKRMILKDHQNIKWRYLPFQTDDPQKLKQLVVNNTITHFNSFILYYFIGIKSFCSTAINVLFSI